MSQLVSRVTLIILDSVGIGEMPDAADYRDQGCNTIGNCALAAGGLKLPHLGRLGLGNIGPIKGVPPVDKPAGAYGKMEEKSPGKDTTTGHWELSGIVLPAPFPLYPDGFPPEIMDVFEARIGRKVLGNKAASGTGIIDELGEQHMQTARPIVYTSADSVFQIAAHEEIIPLSELYSMCETAREILSGPHAVGRVIARPFIGRPGSFQRTSNRHDYSIKPPQPTMLNLLQDHGLEVMAVGKIKDIFAGSGISRSVYTKNNMDGVDKTLDYMREKSNRGLIFTNLVDFDSAYGHRRDPQGYARALEAFDQRLPEILDALRDDEILMMTADHGCDPTFSGSDHTREYVPLLVYGKKVIPGTNLGTRRSFADLGATIAGLFGLGLPAGESFVETITGTGA